MGPTASGKSGVAIKLAQKFDGEIISADSRQIYKGLDIGSGKVCGAWSVERGAFISEGIPHHLIDVAKPQEDFNVSHFKKLAQEKIGEILSRKKVPIICGGTAFWIDTLTKNSNIPEVAPNEKLRARLAKKSVEQLFTQLKKLDPVRASDIDGQNKVRLIRAIEICKVLGHVPKRETWNVERGTENTKYEIQNTKYNFLEIGIEVPREILNAKIKKRLDERFAEGMTQEVENLNEKGVSWQWLERIGLEYRWISRFLQGKIELGEMSTQGVCTSGAKQKLYFDSIHYAKRQMTWLQRNKSIIWHSDYEEIEKEVENFLEQNT